jgi:protein TonB
MHIGGKVQKPVVLHIAEPTFSEEAKQAKFSGIVEVSLIVEKDGTPSHVQVVKGAGHGLDEKAVAAVRQYRFKPATLMGQPVRVALYVSVNFHILE